MTGGSDFHAPMSGRWPGRELDSPAHCKLAEAVLLENQTRVGLCFFGSNMAKSSPSIVPDTRRVLAEADAHGRALKTAPCGLIAAEYKPKTDTFVFTLRDKSQLVIPRGSIGVEAIVKAEPKHLRRIEIDEFCTHVWLPDLDEGVNPVGMFARKLNPALQAERGRKGGSKKSAAKSRAARKNGASGGRPRRKAAKLA